MNTAETDTTAAVLAESAHARQLERGFPWLIFEPPLEQEFRQLFLAVSLPQVRRNLWIAMIFVIGISALSHGLLDASVNRLLDTIRLAVLAPLLVLAMVTVYTSWYRRIYSRVCLFGAPVFGGCAAVLAVISALHGVSLISTVALVTFAIYFMLGMRFYPAVASAWLVFASYLVAALLAELEPGEVLLDSGTLLGANVIGGMFCYHLEHANRMHFLESHLLTETASRDGLTGIHNRRVFDTQLERLWPQALRAQTPLALMLIDIDHFKAYNDHYGHQAGDECLRQVARCLMHSARRPLDVTARYGGEEFAIVLHDARREHVDEVARKLRRDIEALAIQHQASPSVRKQLTVSIGAACVLPTTGRSYFGFIQLADEALYAAKEQGRDRVVVMDKEYEQLATGAFRKAAAANRT